MTAHYDARHRDIVSYLEDGDVARFYQLYSQLHTASMHLNMHLNIYFLFVEWGSQGEAFCLAYIEINGGNDQGM